MFDEIQLTKQGVRALGYCKSERIQIPPDCDHRKMQYCCHGKQCGHLICACGLSWDEGAEK